MRHLFLANPSRPSNVVFDLDGVVFLGTETIAGAGEAIRAMAGGGINVVFATNNATKTRSHIARRIEAETGFSADPGAIATSATAVGATLEETDDPILAVGEDGLLETLTDAGRAMTNDASAAGTVVVGLDRAVTYDKLERASTAIRNGARFVATNTDVTFPTPQGPVPGAGSIVAAVAAAAGREPEVMGKPHAPMVRHVSHMLVEGDTWMVGDRPETDLALARAAGWTAVLTLSGVTTEAGDVPADLAPDIVVDSIADFIDWFGQ